MPSVHLCAGSRFLQACCCRDDRSDPAVAGPRASLWLAAPLQAIHVHLIAPVPFLCERTHRARIGWLSTTGRHSHSNLTRKDIRHSSTSAHAAQTKSVQASTTLPARRMSTKKVALVLVLLSVTDRASSQIQKPDRAHSESEEEYWRALDDPQAFRTVPKVLHAVFINDGEKFAEACKTTPRISCETHLKCKELLVGKFGWTIRYWEYHNLERLIKRHYLHLWDTFRFYDKHVKRSDMARALILHRHGGLYLDMDVECYSDPWPLLEGATVVLQGSGFEGVTNSIVASAPRAPIWDTVLRTMLDRVAHYPEHDAWKDGPIWMTGPLAIKAAVQDYLHVKHDDMVAFGYNGTKTDIEGLRIHRLGTFYMPCWHQDHDCLEGMANKVQSGMTGSAVAGKDVVGHHLFASSWG